LTKNLKTKSHYTSQPQPNNCAFSGCLQQVFKSLSGKNSRRRTPESI